MISPKIAGGYLYISNEDHAVEIDPSHSGGDRTLDGYLFCIRNKVNDSRILSVDTKGNGYFAGNIKCKEGNIANWFIEDSKISATTAFHDGIGQILELNSKDVCLKSTSTSRSELDIPVTNTSIVSDGCVKCRTFYGTGGPNHRSEYMTSISGRNIKCEMNPYSDHPETCFELDDSCINTEVPIYYKDEQKTNDLQNKLDSHEILQALDIVDSLTSTAANKPLSANQGKILNHLITHVTRILGDNVDKIPGKALSSNDYTIEDKNKLKNIAPGAEANVQADKNVTNTASDAFIKNKSGIPTKISQLTNDSGFKTTDNNTWKANTKDPEGYVARGSGNANKV